MTSQIDLERYDRQNRTYGKEATTTLANSTVVVIGLSGGLATESCKNLLLSGVQHLILVEDEYVNSFDLTTGFYYQESDIGSERHAVLAKKLSELNPYCNISFSKMEEIDFTKKIVILHNSTNNLAIKINKECRINNSKFIWVQSRGASGIVFVDCLENHNVTDMTGEIIEPVQLASISEDGLVTCAQHNTHDFQTNDTIKITNVVGENVNFLLDKNWEIEVVNKTSFRLKDFVKSEFIFVNGTATHIKKVTSVKHNSLESQLTEPSIVGFNQEFDSEIIKMYEVIKHVPHNSWGSEMDEISSKFSNSIIGKLVRSFNTELMPVISVMGSLAAMEVIKAVTCKFSPISQWMVYSDEKIIPNEKPTKIDPIGIGNLLGTDLRVIIENSNWLMVGCGAIGCEMLKNLAKMNFATGKGKISVTDPDHIERSNLSRQFLFRNEHIKSSKSKTASQVVNKMNPNINIEAMTEKMCPENQKLMDKISGEIIGVINALDNIAARRYMDEQCFRYGLPLFESGTQGMKGNTQPVIPFVTETYSNSSDPPQEKSFPVCTIKNFPNQPEHTIHWAMDYFEQFKRAPENLNNYKVNGSSFLESLSAYDQNVAKEDIHNYTIKYNPENWKNCARWASDMYLNLYRDQILQLLHNFPVDSYTSTGELFWSKGKRCPKVMDFDLTNEIVVNFLEATTHLLARNCKLDDTFSREELIAELVSFEPYHFQVDEDKKIAKDDSELDSAKQDTNVNFEIPSKVLKYYNTEIFEKDDDTNWHVAFVTAAANMRSLNYQIPTSTFDEAKGIAGKIVPAVATTTSIVAGLISIEILKYCYFQNVKVEKKDMLESYKSWFVTLADNVLVSSEPITAPMLKFGETEINSWTKFELIEDMTLERFIELYQEKFKTKISMVLHGTSILHADFMPSSELGSLLSKIFNEKYELDLFTSNTEIVITSEDDSIELPTIEVKLKKSIGSEI